MAHDMQTHTNPYIAYTYSSQLYFWSTFTIVHPSLGCWAMAHPFLSCPSIWANCSWEPGRSWCHCWHGYSNMWPTAMASQVSSLRHSSNGPVDLIGADPNKMWSQNSHPRKSSLISPPSDPKDWTNFELWMAGVCHTFCFGVTVATRLRAPQAASKRDAWEVWPHGAS